MNINTCNCAEGKTSRYNEYGRVVESGIPTNLHVHDCNYIILRNALITKAEKLAKQTGVTFFKAMDFLVREHGVVK